MTDEERARFWSKVRIELKPPPGLKTGCWIWTAGKCRGYGAFHLKEIRQNVRAHVLSYKILRGEPKKGEVVRHLCGNRACVNAIEHLKSGSQWENVVDAISSGVMVSFGRAVKKKSSKYKGVSFDGWWKKKPWRAYVHFDNKIVRIGRFKTERQAAIAVSKFKRR